MKNFIGHKNSDGYLEVLEDSELYFIAQKDLNLLRKEIPILNTWYIQILEEHMLEIFSCLDTFHNDFLSLAERYAHFLKNPFFTPAFRKRLSDKMIASFLFVEPETFSRFIKSQK